ncbi:VanZ family protein [Flagellimonas myxillae]|uniref:VanZ family protein n=1 Tax=Flagellimonas myxillae TaxID=2942214 RepID=UPI00201EE73A|nr:VanZ family protein [Muricauda myxillae]MCL6267665.1 VanZ family protein [Muricauda myxillae]
MMSIFTSSREKRLWLYAFAVLAAIFATLFVGRPLANQLRDQNVQAIFFLLGMLLVGSVLVVYGLRTRPGKIELTVLLGIIAVYTLFIFRLGAPERSHLIEFSVLAVFVHNALTERAANGKKVPWPFILTFIITFLIGILDEGLQRFLPNRTFDIEDILFDGMAIIAALITKLILGWVRQRTRKTK